MNVFEVMKRHGVRPDSRLDQNFLIDQNNMLREIEEAEVGPKDIILEVGPGLGVLTEKLAEKAKKVVAIERDRKMIAVLDEEIVPKHSNVEIIEGDALKVDFPKFDKCVSNIPYSISSKLILRLGKLGKLSVLMMQKEFAERLVAKPMSKNYSRVSVMSQFYFEPDYVKTVSRSCFLPKPKVDSAIVRLVPRKDKPKVGDEDFFFLVVRALFTHKNQKVSNALEHARGEFSLDKTTMRELARELPHADRKPRGLGMSELAEISLAFKKRM